MRSCRGVIGHEFSHTFDNDIELNLRLIAVVFGLGCVVEFGAHLASGKRRSNKNKWWRGNYRTCVYCTWAIRNAMR